ncbi:hypothetical protein AVL50_25735 [Flammeovirga sp. SJP92]|nr:hypothetical protein AVL50_25735 [Flammeovirga sp. SJP92]
MNAQSIKVKKGKLSALSKVTSYDVVFSYENMNVGKMTEEDYVAEKVKAYNKKEKGRGDEWKGKWIADRNERFEPKFITLFNKSSDGQVKIKEGDSNCPYEMHVRTTDTEPGFNVGVMRKNAYISMEISFIEKKTQKVLVLIELLDARGRSVQGYDFDTGTRLEEGYAKAGKGLGNFFRKKVM